MDISAMNQALTALCDKYSVGSRGVLEACSGEQTGVGVQFRTAGGIMPLLPWRMTRRFIELRTLAAGSTLEGVSTLRFMYAAGDRGMDALLYRELDLCEWIGGAQVESVFMVAHAQAAANAIVRLRNGVSCSVECSSCLPLSADAVDRHEIIARRGVASDRVVDTQVPQSSIYLFGSDGGAQFTDEDAELFGMDMESIFILRAAFAVLRDQELARDWTVQHDRLLRLVRAATLSAETRQVQKEACA